MHIFYDDKFIAYAMNLVASGRWFHTKRRLFRPIRDVFLHGGIINYVRKNDEGSIVLCLPDIIEIHERTAISEKEETFLNIVDVFTDVKIIW